MNGRQVDRAKLAARAAQRPVRAPDMRHFRTDPGTPLAAPIRRSKATRLTATQRDSTGARSAWNRSPYYWTNPGWSA